MRNRDWIIIAVTDARGRPGLSPSFDPADTELESVSLTVSAGYAGGMDLLRALVLLALPLPALAADPLSERMAFTLGISNRWLTFDYTSDAELEKTPPNPAGVMIRELGSTYFLRLDAALDARGRILIEAGLSPFDLDRQRLGDGRTRDLGTRIRGHYAYLTPMLAMSHALPSPWRLHYGLGAGIGYLRAYGDMIFTEDGSGTRRTVDIGGVGLSVALFVQIGYRQWQGRAQVLSPFLNRDGGAYSMNLNSLDLGYRFTF